MPEPAKFVETLGGALRGEVIAPGDAGYEQARAVYNAMIQRPPAAIARVADVADVIASIHAGRGHGTALAVRGGGDDAGGLGVDEGSDRIRATYGANYERLAAIKRRYDPDNFYRMNQNIPPAP